MLDFAMVEVEGIGNEVMHFLIILALVVCILFAWFSTSRRPLYYDLFLVEMHTWAHRRIVQVVHLGQEFRPRLSWMAVMERMRLRARRPEVPPETQRILSEMNVVIQSPATILDAESTIDNASPNVTNLWEIEVPLEEGQPPDATRDSQLAAAAAIAVLGRRFPQSLHAHNINVHMRRSANGVTQHHVQPAPPLPQLHPSLLTTTHSVEVIPLSEMEPLTEVGSSSSASSSSSSTPEVSTASSEASTTASTVEVENEENKNEQSIEEAEQEEEVEVQEPVAQGDIIIKMKFLDDTQKDALAYLTDTVGHFKSIHFAASMASGMVVRLIYKGQLLRDDTRTLESYGLTDGCIVHCNISKTPYAGQSGRPAPTTTTPSTQAYTADPNVRTVRSVRRTANTRRQPLGGFLGDPSRDALPDPENMTFWQMWYAVLVNFFTGGLFRNMARGFMNPPPDPYGRQLGWFFILYRRIHNAFYAAFAPEFAFDAHNLDRAADEAQMRRPPFLSIGDYMLWIFSCQFVCVWVFVYCFPQLCDSTALGLLLLLTLYFIFVIMRNFTTAPIIPPQSTEHNQQQHQQQQQPVQ